MPEEFGFSNNVRIWSIARGSGLPVLLCNGGPGSADYLSPVSDMIDDLAHVIRFEQRGCGRSEHKPPYDLGTCFQDLEAIRQHYGIQKWVVGGHSWGANLALAYALVHRDRAMGLVYLAGNGAQHDIDWRAIYKKGLEEKGEILPDPARFGNEEVNKQGNISWYDFIKNPMLLKRISELRIPALFVHGQLDIRPGWPAEQIANLMPNARFETIEAEHYLWLSRPEDLKSILREFIISLNWG